MKKQIVPIFFSCDENYIPFLSVTIKSIIDNANSTTFYNIYILHTNISLSSQEIILNAQTKNIKIYFVDVYSKIKSIAKKLDDVRDYYTRAIFFRLFIPSIFKEFDKAIYLDCDIVVLTDIKKLYDIELNENILGVVVDDVVANNEDFKVYTKEAVGVDAKDYFNSGVLLMNLMEYRKEKIEEKFIKIMTEYNFLSVAPDQDFLNFICQGRVKYLDKSWNLMPVGPKFNEHINLIHYNMFMKPWHYDIMYEEYFWKYAEKTEYYDLILEKKKNYSASSKESDLNGVKRMVEMAYHIIDSKSNLNSMINKEKL